MPSFEERPPVQPLATIVRIPAEAELRGGTQRISKGAQSVSSALVSPLSVLARSQILGRQHQQGRKPASLLRSWSRTNEWVRIAINRRKRQISQAQWHVVRTDDPSAPANPKVVNAVMALLRTPNPRRESFRTILDQVLEDVLVIDSGCIEKVRLLGRGDGSGSIAQVHAVDGATIVPDALWDGSDPKAIRYRQVLNGRIVAEWTNDDMIYIMATPTTYSSVGWSPVETAVRSIESDLYGDDFDYQMLQQTQPGGIIDVGNVPDAKVAEFREYWAAEIEGRRAIAIIGGGDAENGGRSAAFIPMSYKPDDLGREKYRVWVATKIAAAFELDLGVFNLTANLHKDTGGHQQALTDEGHRSLGALIEEFLTTELVMEFDENHGLRIADLNARDAMDQADLDAKHIAMGALVPNEIRVRNGLENVPWGDVPFIPTKGPWSGGSALGDKPDDESAPGRDQLLDDDAGGNADPPDDPASDSGTPKK